LRFWEYSKSKIVEDHMSPVPLTLPPELRAAPRVRFKKVLFATDLTTTSASAQAYALLLASMLGSRLFALHVETGPGLSPRYERALGAVTGKGKNAERAGQLEEEKISELKDFFHSSAVPFTLLVAPGEVRDVLTQVVEEHAIDLIILGSHGRKGISHLLLGSIAESVSRTSMCPVITVGPQARSGFENSLKRIVYATDFSNESRAALPYAVSLAQEFHAELLVMHVAPERMAVDRAHVENYLMNRLKNLAPHSRFPWCTARHIVAFGDPACQILNTARDHSAGLIVLGLHRSVEFTSHFPERLSYRVVCDAPCPVMSMLPSAREMKVEKLPADFLNMAPHLC
jgi:nucleotide-binding universal stress UspA family protein